MKAQKDFYDEYWTGTSGWKPTDTLDIDLKRWLDKMLIALPKSPALLDVGCGDGSRYAAYLLDAKVKLHGTDISEVAVKSAREVGLDAVYANLDHPLPYPDEQFDGILCFEVLEHLIDPEFTVKEIYRVLKPGGLFLMSVPNAAAWRIRAELLLKGHFNPTGSPDTAKRYPWRDPHIRFFNNTAVRNLLSDNHFLVKEQGGLDTLFLNSMPVLGPLINRPSMKIFTFPARSVGAAFYPLLAGRCVALASK
jgi:methionine biosynthesis protein MetW